MSGFGRHVRDADVVYRSTAWASVREGVLVRDGYRCQSRHPDHEGVLQVHHVVPLRHGGAPLDEHNLVTLCRHHHERAERLIPETRIVIGDGDGLRWTRAADACGMTPEEWVRATLDRACDELGLDATSGGVHEDDKPASAVLTGYVLLTEWAASDGEVYLTESRPEGQAYWRSLGMLEAARISIDQASRDQALDDDDDDDEHDDEEAGA